MHDYLCILIAVAFSALGIILIDIYASHNNKKYLFGLALICSIIVLYTYSILLKKRDLGKTYVLIKILTMFIVICVGCFIFKEKITTKNKIGVALAIVAVILLAK